MGKMAVSRGNVHEYLGRTLYYTVCGQVSITMFVYIEEILTAFDKSDLTGKCMKPSASPNNIFVVNKDYNKLDKKKFLEFQNIVAKFVC